MSLKIVLDDLSDPQIADFLTEHMEDMRSVSPPESRHALDLESLKQPCIRFWSVWNNDKLVGCGALKELSQTHAEIKSMRTSASCRGKGLATELLSHMIAEGKKSGYTRFSLETGSMAFFQPARRLYEGFGFTYCAPFGNYVEDPNSVFMTLELGSQRS